MSIELSADFSAETLQSTREWHNVCNMLKVKNIQPRILCPARLFKFDLEIKIFIDKLNLKEFRN